jgi:hypothetical protein
LQALIANRRGLIQTGEIELQLLAKWITVVTRWPDMIDAMLIDQSFLKSLKDAFMASEELSQYNEGFFATPPGIELKAKYNRGLANPHVKRLIEARDLLNLLKQMPETEIESWPQYLRFTKSTIGTNVVVKPQNSIVPTQQANN